MTDRFEELRRRLGELCDVEKTAALLNWDEETKMPPAGAPVRAEQRATLHRIAHELQTAPELGALLEELRPFEEAHPYESFKASLVRVARRDYEKAVRVPAELRADLARSSSHGYRAWLEARERRDYSIVLPHLERGLELRRRYVACFEPVDEPYDVLLDDYEPGLTAAEVVEVFDRLKAGLVPLIRAVGELGAEEWPRLRGSFPPDAQRRFALRLLRRFGLDDDAWRLDDTVHPFATALAPTDIRLTSSFDGDGLHGVLSCLHEFGHGLFERQIDPAYARTPLAQGVSFAFHESQSRLWENLVGRNRATWSFAYPLLQEEMPAALGDLGPESFYRALNTVRPTFRRVDADEVTYCLHIIIRFELERALLSGALGLRDLPDAFDAKMQEYLGLEPPDVVSGALQDAHWSDMSLGYFPTYALGNVISVQLWQRARADLGDLDAQLGQGEFGPLRDWLGATVHRWGRAFPPRELLERAVGGPLDPEPYLAYLREKVADLYGIAVA